VTTPENGALLDPLEDLLDALNLQSADSARTAGGAADDNQSDLGVSVADVFIGRSQPMPHGRCSGGRCLPSR
jgi:acyl-CoA thioesterase-2